MTCCLFAELHAFAVYPFSVGGEVRCLKWVGNRAGTPGGTVTWSFIPAGTAGTATYCGDACPGNSVAAINLENASGAGFTVTPLGELEERVTAAVGHDSWTMTCTSLRLR